MEAVQDKLNRIKQLRTSHSTEDLDRLGWSWYAQIRQKLEADRSGDFVMIEVDSGDYFVGKTAEEALSQARATHPDKAFYLIRIGYRAAHKLKRT